MVYAESILSIDKEEAQKHLELLGYKRGDKIFMRYIHANPAEGQPKSIKKSRLNWEECERYQSQGYDAYFVINGGGDTDAAVKVGRAIFYEHDNLPKDIQRELWHNLGLPEPTVQVDTGGKSIHSYWVFNSPMGIKDWCELQEDLLEFADGDRSIKNPSRILRLAGCRYMKGDNPGANIATIITASGKRYSYLELRNVIQVQKPQTTSLLDSIDLPVPESVPLETCLTKRSREMLASGSTAPDKQRNNSGIELARDLIGTAAYLKKIGQAYDGNPEILFFDWCRSVALDTDKPKGQPEAIWKSASKDNPSPGSGEDGVEACIRGWYWNTNLKPSGKGFGSRRVRSGGSGGNGGDGGDGGDSGGNHLEVVSLYKRIEEVLNRQLPDPQQEDAFLSLAKAERISLSDVKGIAKELQVQTERAADLKEDSSQFKKLVSFREQQLNLNATFPTPLAKALLSKASSSRLDPIRLVQNLLPACGAVLGANVSVIAKRGVTERDHWYECPIFWTADISPPSSGKSDAQRASFEPLKEMEREELKRVAEAKKQLPQIEKNWQNFTDQQKEEHRGTDADPEFFKSEYVDKVRRYIWDEATIESLFRLISEQPEKAGTTWLKDELEALFKGLDQHKSGNKGNALQQLLSSWSGPLWGTTDRVDKTKSHRLKGQTLNISGTVQPDVITKRLNVRDDPDGLTSRLLPAMSKLPGDFSQWSDVQVELFDCIKGLLEGLEQMQGIVEFSPLARTRWIQRWEELRRGYQRYLESNPAYAYFLGKQCSYVPRLALLLHCIEHYYQPKSNFAQIALETLEKAITLSDYYCGQFRLLQAASFSQDEFPLEGLLFKVWEKVKALGKISTREVCQFARRHKWHGKKITAGVALEILTAIQTAGFGVLRDKTLYFNSPDNLPPGGVDHVDHVDQMLIIDQHGKNLRDEGVEGFVDHVDQRDDQQHAAISNGRTIAYESSLYSFVDQPDQQMAKAQDSQDLEHVDQLPTFDQHDQHAPQEARALRCCVSGAALKELAQIAPTNPIENTPQPTEVEVDEQTPQQAGFPIYQRLDGTYEVESSTADAQEVVPSTECLLEDGHPFNDLSVGAKVEFFDTHLKTHRVGTIIPIGKEGAKSIAIEIETGGTEIVSFNQVEPIAKAPDSSQPTLAEMQALLLACKTVVEVNQVTHGEHGTIAKEAYRTLSFDDQLKIDRLMVAKHSFPVYKYLGRQDIKRGALVKEATENAISPDANFAFVKRLDGENQTTYTVASKELIEVVRIVQGKAIASTPANVDAAECENPVTPAEIAPEAVQTPVEDEIGVKDEPTKKETRWAWNKTTGESLGEVLFIRGSQAKIRRSGELPRHAKFYPLQEITFDNPVVQALSLNASPAATAQWGKSEQFIEEVDD
jgi:hypothetical protein